MKSKGYTIFRTVLIIVMIALFAILIWQLLDDGNGPKEITYSGEGSMTNMIEKGEVERIFVDENSVAYVLSKNSAADEKYANAFNKNPKKYANYYAQLSNRTDFANFINNLPEDVTAPKVIYNNIAGVSWTTYIFPAILLISMIVVVVIIFRQSAGANKQAMSFGKTKARMVTKTDVKFADVAGAEEEKEELKEIVEFLKSPQKFNDLGARIPKGVLLVGPPGTGKTLFAKAVAGEANVPFFSISGSDFVEMFVGTGAARVRDLFEQAKKNAPCIVFIDEIDAVGRERGAGLGGGHDEKEQTLNQLLVQMDGFEKSDNIIVMAATNRADVLDPALLRAGRFDRQIYVNIPDVRGREAIFKVHSRNKPLAPDVSFKVLARMTSGFSGADIENLLNESAILAARAGRKVIVMEDVLEGINKVIAGPQKRSRVVTATDKRITAYHESGHAILAKLLPNCDEVQEVSIIPRGMAAGYTLTRPENDDSFMTKNKLLDNITMMLGGRAAEEIVIKDITTGASNDIQRASAIAKSMVTEWGMSKSIGNMFLGGSKEVFLGRDYGAQHSYSERLGGMIDSEIKAILDDSYEKALEMIKSNRKIMDNMVKVLFEKETIYTAEVDMLFEGKSADEVIAVIDERIAKKESLRKKDPRIDIVDEADMKDPFNPVGVENEEKVKKDDVFDTPVVEEKPKVKAEPKVEVVPEEEEQEEGVVLKQDE